MALAVTKIFQTCETQITSFQCTVYLASLFDLASKQDDTLNMNTIKPFFTRSGSSLESTCCLLCSCKLAKTMLLGTIQGIETAFSVFQLGSEQNIPQETDVIQGK